MVIERDIQRFLHSRYCVLLMSIVLIALALVFYHIGDYDYLATKIGGKGFLLPSATEWTNNRELSLGINLGLIGLVVCGMICINKWYNVLRSLTMLFASLFLVMQVSTPDLLVQLYSGTVMTLVVVIDIILLFSCYHSDGNTQRVFLIFMLLSLGMLSQYAFVFYIPVFIVGCAQMRIFNARTLCAAVLGTITPVWILAGFGVIDLTAIKLPNFVSIFSTIETDEMFHLVVSIAMTAFLAVACWTLNFMKMISYNAQTRSYNGFMSVLTFGTMFFMIIDFTNIVSYVPLLNYCAAVQVTHLITAKQYERSYLAIFGVIVLYIGLFIWRVAI